MEKFMEEIKERFGFVNFKYMEGKMVRLMLLLWEWSVFVFMIIYKIINYVFFFMFFRGFFLSKRKVFFLSVLLFGGEYFDGFFKCFYVDFRVNFKKDFFVF